jgi:hypothetical protein
LAERSIGPVPELVQIFLTRGRRSRNKVSVGEPAEGSLTLEKKKGPFGGRRNPKAVSLLSLSLSSREEGRRRRLRRSVGPSNDERKRLKSLSFRRRERDASEGKEKKTTRGKNGTDETERGARADDRVARRPLSSLLFLFSFSFFFFFWNERKKTKIDKTTFNIGYLGSPIEEGHSKM